MSQAGEKPVLAPETGGKEYDFGNTGCEKYIGAQNLTAAECQVQLTLLNSLASASKDVRWGQHGEQFYRIVRAALHRRLAELNVSQLY